MTNLHHKIAQRFYVGKLEKLSCVILEFLKVSFLQGNKALSKWGRVAVNVDCNLVFHKTRGESCLCSDFLCRVERK